VPDSFRYSHTMENTSRSPVIQFGVFEIDSRAGELRRNGVKLRIQQQPFQILMALIEHPGQIVSRDELRVRLWPNDTFVDFEHGLNAAVKRLRDVLGESAERPVFIETLPKRGYRFNGIINGHHLGSAPSTPIESPATAISTKTHVLSRSNILVIAALFLLLLALAFGFLLRPKPSPERLEARLTANSAENPVTGAAISPDGKYLAYSDSTGLYLKLTRAGETHPISLPNDFSAMPVSWFPDGTHLLLAGTANRGVEGGLWRVSMYGGPPVKLVDSAIKGSVSPDGQRIAYLRDAPIWGDFGNEIWVVNSDGTSPLKIVSAVGNEVIGALAWAPDNRRVAYIRVRWGGHMADTNSIEIASVKGDRPRIVLSDSRVGSSVYWLPDGRLIYGMREERPNQRDSNAWAVPIDASSNISGDAVRLTRNPGWISAMGASSDGKHLSLLRDAWGGHVSLARLSPDENHILSTRRLTLEESKDLPTAWTADSRAIVFSSDRNGRMEVFKQSVDQVQPEGLASSTGNAFLPRLSPDGTEVLYETTAPDAPREADGMIMAVPVNGGVSRKILTASGLSNLECTRSPANFCVFDTVDGKRTTFFRLDPAKGATSELTHVEKDGLVNWGLSPDGSHLALLAYAPESHSMLLYSIKDGKTRDVTIKDWYGFATLDWAADSKSMFIGTLDRSGRVALLRVTLDGNAHVLQEGTFPTLCGCAYWAIPSPDGKWIAVNQPGGSSNVWGLDLK
jgi:Tol biopolymer transport system component/DNA-binding winged helix-turn-helix (wHTH) protein